MLICMPYSCSRAEITLSFPNRWQARSRNSYLDRMTWRSKEMYTSRVDEQNIGQMIRERC